MESIELTRRNFLKALAASVLVAGVALPIGLRREHILFARPGKRHVEDGKSWDTAYSTLSQALGRLEPGGTVYVDGVLDEEKEALVGSPDPKRPLHIVGGGVAGNIAVSNNTTITLQNMYLGGHMRFHGVQIG